MSKLFFGALAAVTLLPLLGLPIETWLFGDQGATIPALPLIILIAGPAHIASSAFFYMDAEFRPVIERNKVRFLWSLFLVPAAMAATVLGGPPLIALTAILYPAWLFWHYQRQNYGLVALSAGKAGPIPKSLKWSFYLTAFAGISATVGLTSVYPTQLGLPVNLLSEIHEVCRAIGLGLYLCSVVLLAIAARERPTLFSRPRSLTFILATWAFFIPALIANDAFLGVAPYAIAHGLQYILMMSMVSKRSRYGWYGFAFTVAALAIYARAWTALNEIPVMFQITIGLAIVHFLIDAKLWRMREAPQGTVLKERLRFAFS